MKIKALLTEEFIITEMKILKEQGIEEKIMDNIEIRAIFEEMWSEAKPIKLA